MEMANGITNIKIVEAGQGRTLGVAGDNYRLIVTAEQTGGAYSCIDMLVPPGGGPLPHTHPEMEEFFYVIEGEVIFKTEAGHTKVTKGGFVQIPLNGGVHCFYNASDVVARLLCTVMPAGLEDVFMEIGERVDPGVFLPVPEMTPELRQKLNVLEVKLKQTIYPADYLD
jgi:quercetin dioxygenase-like cupin family protein